MDAWMNGWMNGWMDEWMVAIDRQTDAQTDILDREANTRTSRTLGAEDAAHTHAGDPAEKATGDASANS